MIGKYNESSDYIAGTGLFLDMVGGAANLAARDLKNAKYAVRGQDLFRQAEVLTKASVRASAIGGAIGVVDNTILAINDFSNGNNVSGVLQTTQAGVYATGLVFLAIPGGQVIGGGLILAAGVSDLVEYLTNQ